MYVDVSSKNYIFACGKAVCLERVVFPDDVYRLHSTCYFVTNFPILAGDLYRGVCLHHLTFLSTMNRTAAMKRIWTV